MVEFFVGLNDSCENFFYDISYDMAFVYSYIVPSLLLMEQFDTLQILCRYNVDTLNICMKKFGSEKKLTK